MWYCFLLNVSFLFRRPSSLLSVCSLSLWHDDSFELLSCTVYFIVYLYCLKYPYGEWIEYIYIIYSVKGVGATGTPVSLDR